MLFMTFIGISSYGDIRDEFRIANTDYDALAKMYGGSTLVPVFCVDARGTLGVDYEKETAALRYDGLRCWYSLERFRQLYPEYRDLKDHDLELKLNDRVGLPIQRHPWLKVRQAVGTAFGVPLAVLLMGLSLKWVFAGFKKRKVETGV
ncbi:MAG TPA: hypothetical protein VK638_50245 [Edaphobacter sp.]|nr:hypothetical protein [Edaphobacter sp.]